MERLNVITTNEYEYGVFKYDCERKKMRCKLFKLLILLRILNEVYSFYEWIEDKQQTIYNKKQKEEKVERDIPNKRSQIKVLNVFINGMEDYIETYSPNWEEGNLYKHFPMDSNFVRDQKMVEENQNCEIGNDTVESCLFELRSLSSRRKYNPKLVSKVLKKIRDLIEKSEAAEELAFMEDGKSNRWIREIDDYVRPEQHMNERELYHYNSSINDGMPEDDFDDSHDETTDDSDESGEEV